MRSFLIFLFFSLPAHAQVWLPALYDVTNVAENDVLNVREAPDASAEIVGMLAPDATNIEVIERDGDWGRVNFAETSGWASLTYLTAHDVIGSGLHIEQPLFCSGTEPFWSFTHNPGTYAYFEQFGETVFEFHETRVMTPRNSMAITSVLIAEQDGQRLTGIVGVAACDDGMSERAFGLSFNLLVEGDGEEPYMVQGCCSLSSP